MKEPLETSHGEPRGLSDDYSTKPNQGTATSQLESSSSVYQYSTTAIWNTRTNMDDEASWRSSVPFETEYSLEFKLLSSSYIHDSDLFTYLTILSQFSSTDFANIAPANTETLQASKTPAATLSEFRTTEIPVGSEIPEKVDIESTKVPLSLGVKTNTGTPLKGTSLLTLQDVWSTALLHDAQAVSDTIRTDPEPQNNSVLNKSLLEEFETILPTQTLPVTKDGQYPDHSRAQRMAVSASNASK